MQSGIVDGWLPHPSASLRAPPCLGGLDALGLDDELFLHDDAVRVLGLADEGGRG